jgi:ankyrin repeat protein
MFDRPDPGAVLLHGAACIAAEEFFDWVLNQTRNPNQPDAQGSTPLHFAVGCANVVHVDKLLARGANVNAKDAKGQSPITRLYQRSLPIATSLLKAGANPSDSRDNGDITVLMSVVYTDDFATTKLLVDHGANVNAKNSLGATAMHEAARLGRDNAAKALVTAKGIKLDELNNAGLTALHIAAEQGAPEIVRILLQNGANRSVRTPSGKTALELAEAGGPGYAPTAALLRDGAK